MRGAPVFISTVMVCPSLSCSSLSGIPMFLDEHSQPGQRLGASAAARMARRENMERRSSGSNAERPFEPAHARFPACSGRAARQRVRACAWPPALAVRGRGAAGAAGAAGSKAHGASAPPKASSLGRRREECWRAHPLIAPLPVAILGTPSVHGGGALRLEKCTFEAQAPLPGASCAAAQAAVSAKHDMKGMKGND